MLAELVRREFARVVVQRLLRRLDHAVDVVRMLGVVVDLERHVVPAVAPDLPVGRQPGEERQQFRFGLVFEVIAAVLRPLALQVARRERDLPGGRRDRGLEVHPVRAAGQVVVVPLRTVVDRRHPRPFSVTSPVIATSRRTGMPVRVEMIAVTMPTPAEGPSFGTAPSGRWTWMSLRAMRLGLTP